MVTFLGLEGAGDSEIVHHLSELFVLAGQPVLKSNVRHDGAAFLEIRYVLIDHGQWRSSVPFRCGHLDPNQVQC